MKIKSQGSQLTRLAVAIATVISPVSPLQAQDIAAVDGELEELVVVGSRRKDRTVADSSVPIDILDAETLNSNGFTETNMLLSNLLPSFNFPLPAITDGTDHVRPAQLRGLAPDHTLVLINGKRRHASAMLNLNGSTGRGSTAIDLNMIPANAIKRIEVLRDGAAAQYGSDAIAGVINIVLNDAREGGEISATYGRHETTMEGIKQLKAVGIDGNGNLEFTEGGDRERSDGETVTVRSSMGFDLTESGYLNVSAEYRDRNPTNRSDYDFREAYSRIGGALDPRELTYDRYNTRFGNSEVEDYSLFYNAGIELDTIELYSFGSYGVREGRSGGFNRLPGNSRNITAIYPDGFLPFITSDIDDMSFAVGVLGQVNEWDYDASVVYGRNEFEFGVTNSLNTSLGPESPTSFDAGTLTNEQLTANLDVSRLVDWDVLDYPINVAFGFEYRNEDYKIEAGEEASYIRGEFGPSGVVRTSPNDPYGAAGAQVFPGFTPESEVDDGRHSVAAYIDLDTNITDAWNLAIATRYEDYSDFGSTLNGKFATRYELADNFALRGSVSTGFRAPALAQQFFTSVATVFVNGVPSETGTFPPSSDVAQALGSPGLDDETSLSFSAGLSWQPFSTFNVTLDFYRIEIDDRIVLSSNLSGTGVESLLAGTGANRARFFMNGIDTRTQGTDLVLTYSIGLLDYGELRWNLSYNYNDTEVTDIIDPPAQLLSAGVEQDNLFDFNEFARFEEGSPDTKLNASVTWLFGNVQTLLRATRYGETSDPSSIPARNEVIEEEWLVDLDITWDITDSVWVGLGANNLFDEYPDPTRDLVDEVTTFSRIFPYSGFSPYGFNGRFVYGKLGMRF